LRTRWFVASYTVNITNFDADTKSIPNNICVELCCSVVVLMGNVVKGLGDIVLVIASDRQMFVACDDEFIVPVVISNRGLALPDRMRIVLPTISTNVCKHRPTRKQMPVAL